ncbi:MAG TPA: hypothetical protein VEM13_06700 [Gemmatimonadales bacterium]|nr:hypothetical protein [Gemmatimonadales bacterium]
MRIYALLLGSLLTLGFAYLAQVGLQSSGLQRVASVPPDRADPPVSAEPDPIRYGGTIDPITIQVRRDAPPAARVSRLDRVPEGPRCGRAARRQTACQASRWTTTPEAESCC